MPAIGMESEFNVWIDEQEIIPEKYWNIRGFIADPLLASGGELVRRPPPGAPSISTAASSRS